jgi:hypothetical protein
MTFSTFTILVVGHLHIHHKKFLGQANIRKAHISKEVPKNMKKKNKVYLTVITSGKVGIEQIIC